MNKLRQRVFRTRAEDTLPHTIAHQRIYIVPSKRGCAFLLTLLMMLVASINYSLSLGYALCFLLTGLFSATLLHTYRNLAGLSITAIDAQNSFCGEAVRFSMSLHNAQASARHGISITTRHKKEHCHEVRVRVEKESTQTARVSINAQARGVCDLGRLTLQSDWPMGLWTCWSYLHVARHALIFPAPELQAPALPVEAGSEQGSRSSAANTGDVAGLRDYQPGDSIGSIAWKSAARGLGLRSRIFENEDALSSIMLDLQFANVPGLEAKLSRLCAWVLAAESSQSDYALRLTGFALEKGRGTQQQTDALRALALYGHPPPLDTGAR